MFKPFFFIAMLCFLSSCASVSATSQTETPAPNSEIEKTDTAVDETMMIPDNAIRTASGYVYVVLTPGNGEKPRDIDAVKVHLRVLSVEGTVVDEDSATLAYSHSTPFLTEMLSVMDIGSKIRVWGESQARIWEIELLGIDESYRAPDDVASIPEDAFHLEAAPEVRWRLIEAGNGENAHKGQVLRVQASRWKSTGEILESNRASRGMIVFLNDESQQFDPVHDAMFKQMNEGAHVRLWIPASNIGADYDLVEDVWLIEFLPQLETPLELTAPEDKNVIAIHPDGAWMRFDNQGNESKLVENDAVHVDMSCWNASNGALVDSSYLRGKHDIMEIKPALGIWFDIMKQTSPNAEFMVWLKASAMPEQVTMDLACRVHVFDKLAE